MKKIALWILTLSALTPLVFDPGLVAPFIYPKMVFVRGIAFFVFLLITLMMLFSQKDKDEILDSIQSIIRDPLFLAFSANIFLLAVSTLCAFDTTVAFFGEPLRGEGFLTLFSLYVLYICMRLLFQKKEWNKFFIISSSVAMIVFGIEVVQALQGAFRPDALAGNPIFLATYYLFAIFSGYYVYQEGREKKQVFLRILGLSAIPCSVIGILLTQTRGTMLGLFTALVVCALVALFMQKRIVVSFPIQKISIGILIFCISFSALFIATRQNMFWQKIPGLNRVAQTINQGTDTSSRLLYTRDSLKAFSTKSSPKQFLFGWGWDNYAFFWTKYYDPQVFFYDNTIADRAHNKLIDLLVMSGILGLLSYLAVWFFFIKKILMMIRTDSMLGLFLLFFAVSFFVNNLFVFDTITTLVALYALFAVASHAAYEKQ